MKLFMWMVCLGFLMGCSAGTAPSQGAKLSTETELNHLAVIASDYSSGELLFFSLVTKEKKATVPVHGDAMGRWVSDLGLFVVVNAMGADNLMGVNPKDGSVAFQVSVGRQTNPQDIVMTSNGNAYVSRFDSETLAKLHLEKTSVNPEVRESTSVTAYADNDGFAEMYRMKLVGERVWLLLQRLNRNDGYQVANYSSLLLVDPKTDQVTQEWKLTANNPVTEIKVGPSGDCFVGLGGKMGMYSELDGGIERLDPQSGKPLGLVVTEAQLGGDIVDFEVLDSGYIAIVAWEGKTSLVFWNQALDTLTTLHRSEGYDLRSLIFDPSRGQVYVADRLASRPSVTAWSVGSWEKQFEIVTELPPYHMELLP